MSGKILVELLSLFSDLDEDFLKHKTSIDDCEYLFDYLSDNLSLFAQFHRPPHVTGTNVSAEAAPVIEDMVKDVIEALGKENNLQLKLLFLITMYTGLSKSMQSYISLLNELSALEEENPGLTPEQVWKKFSKEFFKRSREQGEE